MLTRGDEFNRLAAMLGTAERIRFLTPCDDNAAAFGKRNMFEIRSTFTAPGSLVAAKHRDPTRSAPPHRVVAELAKTLDLFVMLVEEFKGGYRQISGCFLGSPAPTVARRLEANQHGCRTDLIAADRWLAERVNE